MSRMDFSTDDKHRATLEMLRETLEYLERLPPVPVTREFCSRLRAHLDEPTQRLLASGRRELHGVGPYTVAGIPLLEASVVDEVLTVALPTDLHSNEARQSALDELMRRFSNKGVKVQLYARNTVVETRVGRSTPREPL